MSVCLSVCLFVCPSQNAFNSGSPYTVENASNAALIPTSPEMKPGLAAVGSATVAVLSQSSGIAAIFAMRRVTWYRSGIIAAFTYCCTIIAPFTCCCTNRAVASTAVVRE